mmetsp:Transcript_13460/g.27858  ORF Transcript_13460/g.27858 Transcript_13460/m.27858 type:complete len:89 (+) Transcript_13460:230-496(+)
MGTNVLASTVNAGLSIAWAEGDYTARRNRILKNITDLREQIKLSVTEEEKAAFESSLKIEIANLEKTNKEQEISVRKLEELDLDVEAP